MEVTPLHITHYADQLIHGPKRTSFLLKSRSWKQHYQKYASPKIHFGQKILHSGPKNSFWQN